VRFGFRDYDPEVGRWTAKVPIGFEGGQTNIYNYCYNNPILYIDRIGLRSVVEDGPRYGNWCGGNWSGGIDTSTNCGVNGSAPPIDSLDECCKNHDLCYERCVNNGSCNETSELCFEDCDNQLDKCAMNLGDIPSYWESPPPRMNKFYARWYQIGVKIFFHLKNHSKYSGNCAQ